MNTMFLLLAEFESPTIPLDEVAQRYLNMSPQVAAVRAAANELPFPTFRMGASQKAPRMVHIRDLADFIDTQKAAAKKEWEYARQVKGK
ncbi:pyocin activator PrtN family protein [Yokenella regensburgei]|uniref:pyocin activator PrtN family protein n=1 Tax=Yokenella regensburgei TaxID=158877 RepID=UPI001375D868|nr:pyocin activator PrtN family protein [Yokenella regensburgei]KAF1368760.1 hypothetical protein FHR25_002510 [Yokenella regensburgei]